MIIDERYARYKNSWQNTVPGLVRMDRAVLYLRQRLRAIIDELDGRPTKTIGEAGDCQVRRFAREAFSISQISGDRQLAILIDTSAATLSPRSSRRDTLESLRNLLSGLEAHEPPADVQTRRGGIGEPGTDGAQAKVTDKELASDKAVFVIMPFAVEFTDVWKGGIQRAAQSEGFTPIRVDMINRSTNITDDIVASIEKCRLAIVDVTKNNPNVMFELGYAIAKGKKNIVISQSADFLPFDIRNIRTIVYANTWSGIEELKGRIQEFLKETMPPKHAKKASK